MKNAGLILFCLLAIAANCAAAAARPNIVFILADDLGYTDLACYGSKYYETPHLDRMADQGLRFTSGYTCGPNCQPTRAALMTGQYGPRTGVYTVGSIDRFNWRGRPLRPVDNAQGLPLNHVTIAQALKKAGYVTAMYGKWHLGQNGSSHPARRGFDEAIVSMGKHFDFKTSPEVDYPPGTYLADFLTDKAVDFIRRNQQQPFFLYLPHFGVHGPHEAKKELIEKFRSKPPAGGHADPTYAAMIYSLDESVGRVLKALDELKLSENTLVIFSSDNGGVGGYAREGLKRSDGVTDNAPLRGGKGMLYEGGIRVPWIFRWPRSIPAKTVTAEPIISVDLFPSLLEVAQAQLQDDQPLDGVSLLALLKSGGQAKLKRDAIYWHFPGYLGAGQGAWRTTPVGVVRSGDWKLMEFFEDNRVELYNLRDDIGEKNNLATRRPDHAKDLRSKLASWRKQVKAPMPAPQSDDPPSKPGGARKKSRRDAVTPGRPSAATPSSP